MLLECVAEYAEESGTDVNVTADSTLLGSKAPVTSLGLVMIVTSFEGRLNELSSAPVVLANEAAMSMRQSPFRSVSSLVEYAEQLLLEAEKT